MDPKLASPRRFGTQVIADYAPGVTTRRRNSGAGEAHRPCGGNGMARCSQESAVPSGSTAGLRKTDNLELTVKALFAKRRQRIGYEGMLRATNRW